MCSSDLLQIRVVDTVCLQGLIFDSTACTAATMFSKRTQQLFLRSLTSSFFKHLMTPANYGPVSDQLVRSTNLPLLIYWLYFIGISLRGSNRRPVTDSNEVAIWGHLTPDTWFCRTHRGLTGRQLLPSPPRFLAPTRQQIHKDLGELNYE